MKASEAKILCKFLTAVAACPFCEKGNGKGTCPAFKHFWGSWLEEEFSFNFPDLIKSAPDLAGVIAATVEVDVHVEVCSFVIFFQLRTNPPDA